jgi:uncharacterized lipoprotein YmbA
LVAHRRLPVLLILLGTLGCRALLPKSAKTDFFLLTVPGPSARAAPAAASPSVMLGPVALPEYLDRPELVTRLASNQVRVEDLELWAEPLRDSFPRTVQENLATLLGGSRVQHLPWSGESPPDLVVSVEVGRFEKTAGGHVELSARWMICDGRGEKCLRRATSLSYVINGTTTQAAVASMSEALTALSREIAGEVQRLAHDQANAATPRAPG